MYELKNYMEFLVEEMIESTIKKMDICKCNKCRLDIMAIALNSLQPRYVVSPKGNVYVKINTFEQQSKADVISAISKAAMIVGENQRHDER